MRLLGTTAFLSAMPSTPTTTSSRPWLSSHPSAVRRILMDRLWKSRVRESLPQFLHTGRKRPEREAPMTESSGRRPSTGWKRLAVLEAQAMDADMRKLVGLRMPGPPSQVSIITVVDLSNSRTTTTMEGSQTSSRRVRTTARCSCLKILTYLLKTAF